MGLTPRQFSIFHIFIFLPFPCFSTIADWSIETGHSAQSVRKWFGRIRAANIQSDSTENAAGQCAFADGEHGPSGQFAGENNLFDSKHTARLVGTLFGRKLFEFRHSKTHGLPEINLLNYAFSFFRPQPAELFERIRWPATIGFLSFLLLLCVILVIGVCRNSRCSLILFSVIGLFGIIICWLLSGIYLASTVAIGDFCMQPTTHFCNKLAGVSVCPGARAIVLSHTAHGDSFFGLEIYRFVATRLETIKRDTLKMTKYLHCVTDTQRPESAPPLATRTHHTLADDANLRRIIITKMKIKMMIIIRRWSTINFQVIIK